MTKSKLNSIETLISQALIDMEISHEKFITILKEKDKYEKMKDDLKSENEKHKIIKLSSIKSKTLNKLTTNVASNVHIKTRRRLIAWSVEKIQKILTQKCLE